MNYGQSLPKRKKKQADIKSAVFVACIIAWPILQFAVFYIGVNINSILLAFKKIDPTNYSNYAWTFQNFKYWFANKPQLQILLNSLCLTNPDVLARTIEFVRARIAKTYPRVKAYGISLCISLPLGLFFSYYIFKKFPGASAFRVFLFMPSIISSIVLVMIYAGVVSEVVTTVAKSLFNVEVPDLLGTERTQFATVMVYNIFVGFGTNVLMYSNKMSGISTEVVESAGLDGASGFKEFWHIALPCAYPTLSVYLVAGVAGIFMNQLNNFTFYGFSYQSSTATVGFLMYFRVQMAHGRIDQYPTIAALGLIITAVAVPLTLVVRYLLEKYGPSED